MRFRWFEYSIYPITFMGLALALALVAIGVATATILIAIKNSMLNPFRSFKNLIIALATITTISGAGIWGFYTHELTPVGPASVTVTQDMSFAQLTDSLTQLGVIEYPKFFKACARLRGIDKHLGVGRYDFSGAISTRDILDALQTGKVVMISVTIPEGLRIEQTAGILAQVFEFDSTYIVKKAFDTAFCKDRYNLSNLEGYLFPETYNFPVGPALLVVLDKLVADTKKAVSDALKKTNDYSSPENALNHLEILTLASIIEAEARLQSEQRLISGVYRNRLNKGMLLQADPTVRYGLRLYSRKLYFKDLDKDTPYNTYMNKGLPPGPINSPGKSAISAALQPKESPYLYFVADGSGGHVFSETLAQHNRANRRIKSKRK